MTYAEIRNQLHRLTKEERENLALDLKALALLDDPEYRAEIERMMDEVEAGTAKGMSEVELRRLLAGRGIEV